MTGSIPRYLEFFNKKEKIESQIIKNFFSQTFYAFQYKNLEILNKQLEKILKLLQIFNFIKIVGGLLKPTRIGKRVSELYIDPLTANHLITCLQRNKKANDFAILQAISNTMEMKPLLSIKKAEFGKINETIIEQEPFLLQPIPSPWDLEYDDFLKSIKTAMLFKEWIEEAGEDKILEKFGVTPGELRVRLNNADWLLYSMQELGLLLGLKDILKEIRKVRLRIKYGVKEELLPLVKLKGIGRVKARKLFNSGIKTLAKLRKVPEQSLAMLIGPKTAKNIKEQLGKKKEIKQEILKIRKKI